MGVYRMPTDTPMEHAQPEEQDLLPEIVLDETAEGFVPDDDPPVPVEPELELELELEEENEVVVMEAPALPPAPEQDNIFQTGRPVKKKRQVSEKQRAHLDRIRAKALERKKEKADERAQVRSALEPAPAPAPAPAAPKVQPVPQQYLTHDDVDAILSKYDERRLKKKESKRKEEQAQQLVRTHIQTDDVWEQCFR